MSYSLACKSELVANFLQSFLVATYAETFAYDDNLSLLQYVLKHVVQLQGHALMVYRAVGAAVIATGHDVEHTVFLTILKWCVYAHMVAIGHHALPNFLLVDICCLCQLCYRRSSLVFLLEPANLVVYLVE